MDDARVDEYAFLQASASIRRIDSVVLGVASKHHAAVDRVDFTWDSYVCAVIAIAVPAIVVVWFLLKPYLPTHQNDDKMKSDKTDGTNCSTATSRIRETDYDDETGLTVPFFAIPLIICSSLAIDISQDIEHLCLPYVVAELGENSIALGRMQACAELLKMASLPMFGYINGKFGRRSVLVLCLILQAAAQLGQGYATSFDMLFVSTIIGGPGYGGVTTASQVYLADVCSDSTLGRYLGWLVAASGFGRVIGNFVGGQMSRFGFRVPLYFGGSSCLVMLALVYVFLPESPAWLLASAKPPTSPAAISDHMGPERTDKEEGHGLPAVALGLGLSDWFQGFSFKMVVSFAIVSLIAKFNWSTVEVSYVGLGTALFGAIFAAWGMWNLLRTVPVWRLILIGGVFQGGGSVICGLSAQPWIYVVGILCFNVAMVSRLVTTGRLKAQVSNPSNRALIFWTCELLNNAGCVGAPLVGGYVAEVDPNHATWYVSAVVGCIGYAILLAILPGQIDNQPATPPSSSMSEEHKAKDENGQK